MNTETQPETLLMNPAALVEHSALEHLTPALDRALEPAEVQAFRKSIAQQGVLQPVIITWEHGTPYLLDGRRRVEAARDLGIEVPCHAVEPEQAYTVIITALTTHRPLTKTAQTLAALPLLEPALEEAKRQWHVRQRSESGEFSPNRHQRGSRGSVQFFMFFLHKNAKTGWRRSEWVLILFTYP